MRKDELARQKQEKLDKLNELITSTKESAKSIAKDMRDKLELLKVCYDRASSKQKNKVHELINYTQLRSYLAGEKFSNSYETKLIELEHLVYTEKSINRHIENGLPKNNNEQAIEIYSFYFGGYRAFFRCFTKEFLELRIKQKKEFIEDVYSQKENDSSVSEERLEIAGATIIDEEFIETIKTGKHFTEPEFYVAKQNNCQWYGITQGYDIIRKGYSDLKNIIVGSFTEENHEKVTAIVHGSGGSGKSTVLRRLAIDLHKEQLNVLWLERLKIREFEEQGLSVIKNEIKKNHNQRFLIIIEDWYRMFNDKEKSALGIKILEETLEIDQIRIVIGDRNTQEKPYTEHQNNDFQLHLSSDDNREIIEKIIEKHQAWKPAWERLLQKDNDHKPSLFLLLFILARIDQKEFNKTTLNLAEPQQVFQRIIESDLRFIAKQEKESYKGLAKSIHYCASINMEHKMSISYETFLKIADHYNEKNIIDISNVFCRWNADDEILDRLKFYINKSEEGQLQFNHDILAESLSKASIDGWKKFGTQIKLELLDVITEKGDDYDASLFLSRMLSQKNLIKDQEEALKFVNRLIHKNNRNTIYLNKLISLHKRYPLDNADIIELGKLLWEKRIFNELFWDMYFYWIDKNDYISNDIIEEILNKDNLSEFEPSFIIKVLRHTSNHDVKYRFINSVLDNSISNSKDGGLFSYCLSQTNQKEKQRTVSNNILEDKNWKELFIDISEEPRDDIWNFMIVLKSLRYYSDVEVKKKFAKRILNDNLTSIDGWIIQECLQYVSTKEKTSFYKKLLQNSEWKNISNGHELTINAFNDATQQMKDEFAIDLFKSADWKDHLNGVYIIEHAINYVPYETKREFIIEYFESSWTNPKDDIYNKCLQYLENKNEINPKLDEKLIMHIKGFYKSKLENEQENHLLDMFKIIEFQKNKSK
ncbi:hypothetical protein HNP38_002364 [Chryseobacterium defluvii]|uniref:Novel STAND NTPase 5 domain-containing protein n=1 Tax=Chryseobacterium defluvii TaxID=160396 RepID=A0A840KHT6_9FLAO|nr:ATP-binding protein [Chryseobacterium defluvii]MBB4807060.1 hypothetical protein [Chryseobacterium defluvii]